MPNKFTKRLYFILLLSLFFSQKSYSQCFEIESILVDACSPNNPSNDEGYNEMVRFKVGTSNIDLNTTPLTVTWPNGANSWLGLIKNAKTASTVAALNTDISNAGACGQILEPTGGILPANAIVILVTSQDLDTPSNSFASLTGTIYMIFQNNHLVQAGGNFANYTGTPGTRTLVMSFGGSCTDNVTYDKILLKNKYGSYGGTPTDNDGATVNFTPSGTPTYINNGCSAPVPPFTVNAGNPQTVCKGSTISLTGTAQNYLSVLWSAPSGSFSNPSSLTTNYSIDPFAVGSSVTLTLTATNICGAKITSTVAINFTFVALPTVTSPVNYCQNVTAVPLSATPNGGGTLNWYGTNATGGIASPTAPTPSTATIGSTTYYVSQTIAGCESDRVPITVTIANTGPTLNLSCGTTTPTSIQFDWANVGQTNFSYSYTINGGSPITGTTTSTSYIATGFTQGQSVTFTLTANGVSCVDSETKTCKATCATLTAPNFAPIAPICVGNSAPTLSNTSPNGITGTWSPATISSATSGTFPYVFTPDPVLFPCATTQTLTITISDPIIPTFTAVAPICSGATLSPLPTTSNNGIPGTWAPALDNTTTTTYTFTPTAGQCANSTTLSITVNPNVTPTFSAVTPICSGEALSPLPTTSNNGITGTWAPAINNTATTTYTFTPAIGQCATITTLAITVTPNVVPTFTAVAPICSGDALSPLPTTSNNGITGTWLPTINNTATTTYTFTPTSGQCATVTTLTITVTPNVVPTFTAVAPICSGDALSLLPTTSNNGITGTWAPAIDNTTTTIYTFTPTIGQCATKTTLTITVNPNVVPTFTAVSPICIGDTLAPLPTTSNNGITGTWTPAVNNMATTTYTFTPAVGQCATPTTMTITVITIPIVPTFNVNTVECSGSTIDPLPTTSSNGIVGTWSPSINNMVTTTYTFTPNPGQCATSTTLQITIVNSPIITKPTPYVVCDDNNDGVSCLFDLHSKDVEISTVPGIEITYYRTFADSQTPGPPITANPYCNNNSAFTQTIYVRVVDPAAPTCASYTTLDLIVNPAPNVKIPITDYQLCDVNNPGDGIEVFTLSTKDIEIINGQPSMAVTYYLTQADAQAQIPGTQLPNLYSSNTKTIWYNIHSTATGCTNTGSLNLVVNPLPSVLAIVSDYQLCDVTSPGDGKEVFTLSSKDSEITNGQTGMKVSYYLTQANAQNQVNPLPNSYTNVSNPQTIWYSINNTTTKCFSVGSFKLVVNPLPLPLPLQPYAVCDTYGPSSTDGLGEFDLSTLTPKIVYQTPGAYTVTYHKTQADATSGSNPLPLIYHNTTPFVEFIYLRAQNPTTGCFSVMQVELNVDSAPVMPTLAPIVNCDADNNTQDGCTTFNLSAQTPIILAAQSGPAANYTVTYYSSQGVASSTPPGVQIPPNNYVSCGTTTVWVRVDNIVAGCFNVGSFELQVNTPIALNTPTLLSQCDNDDKPNDLHTTFDMCSYVAAYIPAGHTFQFYFDAAHMQPIPCVYKNDINFPANQTVYLEVTNDATGCKSFRTLTLEVLPIPKPKTDPTPLVMCDINNPNDGYEIFDLTTNAAYILNSDANATLHYFASQQDAMDNVNEILNPTTANVNDNVWIRVESKFSIDSNNEHCYVLVEQPIVVNPLPLITPNVVYQECDDDTDGLTVFDLTSQAAALLSTNAPPLSNYSLEFYEDAFLNSQINPATAYTNTSNPQNIYVVATNLTTGCVSPTGLLLLTVNPKPLATAPPDFASCDYDGTNDGYYLLPLDPLVSDILTGQDPNDFTVTFYDTQADATAGTNPIVDTANYMAYTHTVWVRVEDNATGCFRLVSFNVIIEKIPEPTITTQNNSNVICVDFKTGAVVRPLLLEITNPIAGNYTYQWFEAANPTTVLSTDPTYLVDTATLDGSTRSYTVVLTSTTPLSCGATSLVFPVLQSGQAVIVGATGYTISNAFSENQTITVTVDGYGTYAYSLDDGPRQESNVFQNVGLGTHNITVWDTEGGVANSCDPLEITEVQTIDYPHYFTPNGDGINDTWNIVGLANQPTAKIYIFDRYGKLIKQIAPDGLGWDGTYNGNEMPSTDYWFTVDYNEQDALKQFKAHFAMKR